MGILDKVKAVAESVADQRALTWPATKEQLLAQAKSMHNPKLEEYVTKLRLQEGKVYNSLQEALNADKNN